MKKKVELPQCGVAKFLMLLEGPWATLIVRELLPGPRRFNQILEVLPGLSPHTLTRRLRRFEAYGIVAREVFAEVPPRVEYKLTPVGDSLRPVLAAMASWARTFPEEGIDKRTGSQDGQLRNSYRRGDQEQESVRTASRASTGKDDGRTRQTWSDRLRQRP
jgi:DNA-binding HxlR family transcriptional regulator